MNQSEYMTNEEFISLRKNYCMTEIPSDKENGTLYFVMYSAASDMDKHITNVANIKEHHVERIVNYCNDNGIKIFPIVTGNDPATNQKMRENMMILLMRSKALMDVENIKVAIEYFKKTTDPELIAVIGKS